MRLDNLLKFDDIVIQCHNFPDADTIASGFALYCYLKNHYKKPRLVYGGAGKITKPNLLIMIEKLNIPIEHVEALEKTPELLITVDCHYKEGNVSHFTAQNYAVIDHHICMHPKSELTEIREGYGSCSTILMDMLNEVGFEYNSNVNIATALYYGLYSDTSGFMEIKHPCDRDLRDFANYDKLLIPLLRNSNLSREELEIAGDALKNIRCNTEYRFAVVVAKPCDPNILGFISDLVLQVDTVDTSIVCCVLTNGIKLSVRSCLNEIHADELAGYVTRGIGNGGGHKEKAGGFIKSVLIENFDNIDVYEFFAEKLIAYKNSFDVVYADKFFSKNSNLPMYSKIPIEIGYVCTADILPISTTIRIRSLEAEFEIQVSEDIYLIINSESNIYPIEKEKFECTYTASSEKYTYDNTLEYQPKIIIGSNYFELAPFAYNCIAKSTVPIYAYELKRDIKLYTKWDTVNYMLGEVGDYIAVRSDDTTDAYIIKKQIFNTSYTIIN